MITSNALGHFTYCRSRGSALEEKDKLLALENAMRTINNAHEGPTGKKSGKLKNCPATFLIPLAEGEKSPLREASDFRKYSADHYQGYFHTDHLIPSVFFTNEARSKQLKLYENLTFRYIYDPDADPQEHAELMTGIEVNWYDVKRNIDRLPDFVDPEKNLDFSESIRARLATWLDRRLKERLEA